MNHDLARRAHEILKEALDLAPEEREAFIAECCRDDQALHAEAQSLLAAHGRAGEFLETPAAEMMSGGAVRASSAVRRQIGDFTILSTIASGGMGTVFLAEQRHPRRTVALKIMRPGLVSPAALRRFEYESEILARLQHPNIAHVYDAGAHEDPISGERVAYFAMEYIPDALPITEHASSWALDVPARLRLFCTVCDAVHYGHQKGVIHRDLKPENILVTREGALTADQDGSSAEDGGEDGTSAVRGARAKIIDFGVARAADSDMAATMLHTGIGQLVGTLQYMSPEQCEADPANIDVRSDVYALGVVLYELLCDHPPYDLSKSAVPDAARTIREQPPDQMISGGRTVPTDLKTITLKALEKDRERRYQAAADLAADIRRYLNHEPISARRSSVLYQARMFARRNRALVAGASIATTALIVGTVVAIVLALGWKRAHDQSEVRRDDAERQARIVQSVNDFLNNDLLAGADPFQSPNRDLTVREALDTAAANIAHRFDDEPLVEASVRNTIGVSYLNLGDYPSAEPHLEQALKIRTEQLGSDHPETLASMHELGWLRYHQQRYEEASRLLAQALRYRRAVLGDEHAHTLATMDRLAALRLRQGQFDEAEAMYRQTLQTRRRLLPGDEENVRASMDGLARLAMARGRFRDALPLYEQVRESSLRIWGPEHRYTLYATGNLARLYVKLGRLQEADGLLTESLERARRILGEDHPDTLVYLGDLASLYITMGRLTDAEPLCLEALERTRRVHGELHSNTFGCMMHLAVLRQRQRQFDEAEKLMVEAIEQAKALLGAEHSETLRMLNLLGMLHDAMGRRAEAIELFERILVARQRVLGEDHPESLTTAHNLAFIYGNADRVDDAEELFRQVLEGQRAVLGEAHPDVATTLTNLGHILRRQGKAEEAERILKEAVSSWRSSPSPHHTFAANATGNLADLLRKAGRAAESEPYYRECLEIRRETLADSPGGVHTIGVAAGLLGDTLAELKRFDEAEPLMLESWELMKNSPEPQRQRLRERIVKMYEDWNRTEDAERWRAEPE